jgi:hypothetical protein
MTTGQWTFVVTGFAICGVFAINFAVAWWTEAKRNDEQDAAINDTAAAARRLRTDLDMLLDHLGVEIARGPAQTLPEVPQDPDADTDEIPAVQRPRPAPGPRTVPTEKAITVAAITGDDPVLAAWRIEADRIQAEYRTALEETK